MRLLTAIALCSTASFANPCSQASAHAVVAPGGEPGARIVVSGRVFQPDGRTPAAGVTVYVYQTDARGEYGRPQPRLRAWLKTGPQGNYEFESIRPGAYPGSRVPAHIHFQVWDRDLAPRYPHDLLFEDDPLIEARDRARSTRLGPFAFIQKASVRDGVSHFTYDIRIPSEAPPLEDGSLHGVRACQPR